MSYTKEQAKQYYIDNKEKFTARSLKNKERRNAQSREYHLRDRDQGYVVYRIVDKGVTTYYGRTDRPKSRASHHRAGNGSTQKKSGVFEIIGIFGDDKETASLVEIKLVNKYKPIHNVRRRK